MNPMLQRLAADGPHPGHAKELLLYGRFAGVWRVDHRFLEDGNWHEDTREWTFGWVLGGRAVQDVLMPSGVPDPQDRSGTTVRVYDPVLGAWRINWFGPSAGNYCTLIGRAAGDEIHQEGADADGTPLRWNFSDITDVSFTWRGWFRALDGEWVLEQVMKARRV
ncbi:hypothetical protein [Yinghuangia soli]|uniref:DUF1579 domain-containing protein n=1 Tax=Yinghuangia soli TaxID=2908204 RepID=A0AA41U310_9ACTN|nr:hypothetical protein [Yinghuangia soli]MCF2527624.1 hypothetical protein [Yinghuangia soli]